MHFQNRPPRFPWGKMHFYRHIQNRPLYRRGMLHSGAVKSTNWCVFTLLFSDSSYLLAVVWEGGMREGGGRGTVLLLILILSLPVPPSSALWPLGGWLSEKIRCASGPLHLWHKPMCTRLYTKVYTYARMYIHIHTSV